MAYWRGPPAQRSTVVTELSQAHARKVHLDLYAASTAEVVIDGRSPQCALIQELSQDLVLYRYNPYSNYPYSGSYEVFFRGPIGLTEDSISETIHTVNISATDYRGLLHDRLSINSNVQYTGWDQASIVANICQGYATGYQPAPYDLGYRTSNISSTGVPRDRTYSASQLIGAAIDDLAACINGFDWQVVPLDPAVYGPGYPVCDVLVYYPTMGTTKTFIAEYGVTVSSLTRTVNSQTFANRVTQYGGNVTVPAVIPLEAGGFAEPSPRTTITVPLTSVANGDVVTNPQLHAEGLWPEIVSSPDITVQATLDQQAQGRLGLDSVLLPSYTLTLKHGAWTNKADCWLGDTIELRVRSGRLNVDTSVRIVAIDFDIDDNGSEKVSLTVARARPSLAARLGKVETRLDALSRR
jgi:hypothetical protein